MGMGVLARQPARADMFRVAANMNETYYGEDVQQRKSNLDAPRVTVNNHRMTNVQLPGGQVVQGIRRNNDLGYENQPPVAFESEQPMRPLRYTPGLKCDPALEAMRPERSMKHQALQGGDQWKKKLIQHPQTYEGSFADADMQQFRPYPNPNPMDDPWVQSRLPDQPMGGMQMQMQDAYAANDELTRIKMRNRRFQQSVAADQGLYGPPMPPAQLRGQPWMQQGPMQGPPPMEMGGMCDELAMIDQDLNMTRCSHQTNQGEHRRAVVNGQPTGPSKARGCSQKGGSGTSTRPGSEAEACRDRGPDRHPILRPWQGPCEIKHG